MRVLLTSLLLSCSSVAVAQSVEHSANEPTKATETRFADLALSAIDGSPLARAKVDGKVILVVNVASFCTYTGQYAGLQVLWNRYKDRGLMVLGVPSDEFGQEPGSDAEIKNFCETRFGVTFPILEKQPVRGPTRSPLYDFLIAGDGSGDDEVSWNFEKFLVGRDGKVMGRFAPFTVPLHPQLIAAIELALAAPKPAVP